MNSARSAVDELATAIQARTGLDRLRCEAAAALNLGIPPEMLGQQGSATRALMAAKDPNVAEKAEQAEVTRLFRAHGFTVRSTSQARASKVAPGLPDLFVTHAKRPIGFWWETKRQVGGVLSPDQVVFREDCERCGIACRSGDRYDAQAYLVELGIGEGGD